METGGGEPPKRLAKMKKRCFVSPADYNNTNALFSWSEGSGGFSRYREEITGRQVSGIDADFSEWRVSFKHFFEVRFNRLLPK